MTPLIAVENASRKYPRRANAHLTYGITDLFRELTGAKRRETLRRDEFWAVDHVSFEVKRGETLAFVGRNGSGKTTLLRMMAGLTKPDTGRITVRGRVQALMNLGAGFNMNLSGRENIRNAASMAGLSQDRVKRIYGDIVAFAEIGDFIDSPVGTYSQGMKARLGFSVAIHLAPELLLVDEILSVGDFGFQRKCFARMRRLKRDGVTIVLVSHNHGSITEFCDRAIWLDQGRLMADGPAEKTVRAYLDSLMTAQVAEQERHLQALKAATAEIMTHHIARRADTRYGPIHDEEDHVEGVRLRFLVNGREVDGLRCHDDVLLEYGFRLKKRVTDLNVSCVIFTEDGVKITAFSTLNGDLLTDVHEGEVRCSVHLPDFCLAPGKYVLLLPIHEGRSYLHRNVAKRFEVAGDGRLYWNPLDLRYTAHVVADGVERTVTYEPDPGLPSILSIGQVTVSDGRLHIRGWGLAPKPVTRVAVFLGDLFLGDATRGLIRNDVARSHPAYMNHHGGFEFNGAVPDPLPENAVLRVRAYGGDTLLAEQERPWPAEVVS